MKRGKEQSWFSQDICPAPIGAPIEYKCPERDLLTTDGPIPIEKHYRSFIIIESFRGLRSIPAVKFLYNFDAYVTYGPLYAMYGPL